MRRDVWSTLYKWYATQRTNVDFPFMQATVDNPKKWTAETPYLYTFVIALSTHQQDCEAESCHVGFREIELKSDGLFINGESVLLYGVCRHEHDPDAGDAVPYERMVQDVKLLKQLNHQRRSNEPLSQRTRAGTNLCDEYGIYLIDEDQS